MALDDAYAPDVTGASYDQLKALLAWCNQKLGYHPTIVGGWPAWKYHRGLGSKDIDVVFPSRRDIDACMPSFYAAESYVTPTLLFSTDPYKDVRVADRTVRVVMDVASWEHPNEFKEDPKLELPWNMLRDHTVEWVEDDLVARIPTADLLLLYKLKAWRDRTFLRRTQVLSGFEASILDSKISKDEYDVKHLRPHATNLAHLMGFLPIKVRDLLQKADAALGGSGV